MIVAQLVRASDCGSEGRGFETHHSPQKQASFSKTDTVIVAQLVRASDCGSEGRGFETHHSPQKQASFSKTDTVVVAQLVRASDCGSEGRGFEPHHPPLTGHFQNGSFFYCIQVSLFSLKSRF